ncbi:CBS domain-containing protein [bacterium]|nr:CBS domain-containing protein [bacterium]
MTVRQLLDYKGHQVWTISPQATVFEALELMAAENVGALLIMQQDRLVGIFSERDYARKVILQGKSSRNTTVGELMTCDVLYVTPDATTDTCMALMTNKRTRHLPVLDNGQLVGLISIGDVVNQIIVTQEFTIRELENYIHGTYLERQGG